MVQRGEQCGDIYKKNALRGGLLDATLHAADRYDRTVQGSANATT